jgi:hypothetical protein
MDRRSAAWATRIIQHNVLQNDTNFSHQLHLGLLPAAERENAYRRVRDLSGVYAPVPGDDADVMCVYSSKCNSVYGYVVYERTPRPGMWDWMHPNDYREEDDEDEKDHPYLGPCYYYSAVLLIPEDMPTGTLAQCTE